MFAAGVVDTVCSVSAVKLARVSYLNMIHMLNVEFYMSPTYAGTKTMVTFV